MSKELIKKAGKLLNVGSACSVSAITEKGYPRICILINIKNDGIKTLYFSTGTNSKKVHHYKENMKAGVTFYCGGDSVTLIGNMTILSDKAEKDALWQERMAKHFLNGGKDDPEYAIIKFTTEEATIYIDEEFETLRI